MMKRFRSVIFWTHLVLGISAAVVVLIMSATGVLLTYQRQVQAWADTRGLDGGPPAPGATALPAAELLARVAEVRDGDPTAIRWRAKMDAPVEVVYGREGTVFVNAYTGAVLGTGAEGVRAFFRSVTDWHRWLARSGDSRDAGRAITGAANLAFLFIVVSGFYLWWPRNWTLRAFRNVLLFRGGLQGKARDFNWHNVIGFWSLVPLFLVVLSGVVISYPWAGDLVYRAVGDTPPSSGGPGTSRGGAAPADRVLVPVADPLVRQAMAREEDWRILTMQLTPVDGGVSFSIDRGDGGQPQKRAQLVLGAGGEVLKWEAFGDLSAGRRARSVLRFAHTGEIGGFTGQTLAGAVSLGSLVLVWTGLALSLRRLGAWLRRRRRPDAATQGTRVTPRDRDRNDTAYPAAARSSL